jgi:hypothetical protein
LKYETGHDQKSVFRITSTLSVSESGMNARRQIRGILFFWIIPEKKFPSEGKDFCFS